MGWLDANECFLMEVVVRERTGDNRSTFDITSDDGADAAAPGISTPERAWCLSGVWARSS